MDSIDRPGDRSERSIEKSLLPVDRRATFLASSGVEFARMNGVNFHGGEKVARLHFKEIIGGSLHRWWRNVWILQGDRRAGNEFCMRDPEWRILREIGAALVREKFSNSDLAESSFLLFFLSLSLAVRERRSLARFRSFLVFLNFVSNCSFLRFLFKSKKEITPWRIKTEFSLFFYGVLWVSNIWIWWLNAGISCISSIPNWKKIEF